jgi:hypothetical protein
MRKRNLQIPVTIFKKELFSWMYGRKLQSELLGALKTAVLYRISSGGGNNTPFLISLFLKHKTLYIISRDLLCHDLHFSFHKMEGIIDISIF